MTDSIREQFAELSAIFRNPRLPAHLDAVVVPLNDALGELRRVFDRMYMTETARAEALRGLVALTQAKDHFVRAAVLSQQAAPEHLRVRALTRTPESK